MKSLLDHLESKVIINDLLIKKMKYEVQVIFRESPKKVQAQALAKKINSQLDGALIGLNDAERHDVRKELIKNSFMVLPNPVSENVNYNHVFTTLTNYDTTTEETYLRLTKWINLNTELDVSSDLLVNYVSTYKLNQDQTLKKRLHQPPPPKAVSTQAKERDNLIKQYWYVLALLTVIVVLSLGRMIRPQATLDQAPTTEAGTWQGPQLPDPQPSALTSYNYSNLKYSLVYNYLKDKKNSTLTSGGYLSTIDVLAKTYDTDPLLLIAIIGHEQNFVPRDHPDRDKIINNPYNVFGSWLSFNTDFKQSTKICLNTIETANESRPETMDLIEHLNITYAEDDQWHKGVRQIYKTLRMLKEKD